MGIKPPIRVNVVIPGELTDAIYASEENFKDSPSLIALAGRSISRSCRTSYKRKWTESEIDSVIQGIIRTQSNEVKYRNQSGNEFKMFSKFKEELLLAKKGIENAQ